MLTDLVAVLERLGVRSTAVDLADLLWLAEQLDESEAESSKPNGLPTSLPEQETPISNNTAKSSAQPENGEQPKDSTKDATEKPTGDLHTATGNDEGEESMGGSRGSTPYPTPAAFALPHSRAISHALRPFMRRIPSRTRFALDETATAEHTAQTVACWPRFCALCQIVGWM